MEPTQTADPQTRRRGRPPMVEESEVVAAARRIVVSEGVSKLTMRRLGAALGMDPMVPYRFFKTKDDLLEAILLSIVTDARPEEGPDPITTVEDGFRRFRREIIGIPNLVAVVGPRLLTTPTAMLPLAWVVSHLRWAGMSSVDALRWNTVLLSYVVGSVSFVHTRGEEPRRIDTTRLTAGSACALDDNQSIDLEAHFEWGFGKLIDLLRAEVAECAADADGTMLR